MQVSINDLMTAARKELARAGGNARARMMTPDERRELAKKAAQSRWKAHKALKTKGKK